MNFAFSAHNQFMQSLASAGLFGVFGLLVYLGTTLHYAIVLAPPTRGFSLALGDPANALHDRNPTYDRHPL